MLQRVGIRELRRNSRHYLARVVAGEHFEVTVFGRPIADLGPAAGGVSPAVAVIEEGPADEAARAPLTMRISAVRESDDLRVIPVQTE